MSDGSRPVMHGRDHLPGGADPIPLDILSAQTFAGRYIRGRLSSNSTLHTYEQDASPGGIDSTGRDRISFQSWTTNDDGSVFSNDGAGGLDLTATQSDILILRTGLIAVFAYVTWTAKGITTHRTFGVAATVGSGAVNLGYNDSGIGGSGRYWENFSRNSVTDQAAGTYDFEVRDQTFAYVTTANTCNVWAALRIDHDSTGTIEASTNTFYAPQIGVFWLGNLT